MKNDLNRIKGRRWIIQQTKGCRIKLLILSFTRIVLVLVNLGMAMILSGFVEFAIGNSQFSLISLLAVAGALFILEGGIYVTESICKKAICCNMELKIRTELLRKIQDSDLLEVRNYSSSELMMRLSKDVEQVTNCLPNIIINVFGGLIMAVAAFIYMLIISWKLSLIIIISVPILLIIVKRFAPLVQKTSQVDKINEDINREDMKNVIQNLSISRVFESNNLFLKKVVSSYDNKKKSSIKLGYIEGFFSFLNNLIGSVMFVIVLGVGSYFVSNGEFPVGDMISIINLVNYLIWPFTNISNSISEYSQALVSADRIIEASSLSKKADIDVNIDDSFSAGQMEIKVNNISFSFGHNTVLSKISIDISKNGVFGFVGKSGSGKSTLLSVLMGLYKPDEGNIEYNINNSNTDNLIVFVPADNYIFNGTVRENICMDECCDFEKMSKAAQMANADEFIKELENGYDQLIGEKQNSLSSGQGQRIALARAYYRSSACYVFDEPTSNLDKISVDAFINTVKLLGKTSLCLISSHDKTVLKNCDRIFYISESGMEDLHTKEKIQFYLDNNYIRTIE